MSILSLPDSAFADLPRVADQEPEGSWNGMVLVGEAPGRDEVVQGKPFVGRSGRLLDVALAEVGLVRGACRVVNVFGRRPPDNRVGAFFASRRQAKTEGLGLAEDLGPLAGLWCRAAVAGEVHRLQSAVKAWRPRVVVALGRVPFWAMTGRGAGLVEGVGEVFPCPAEPTIPVLATFHPSFVLRGRASRFSPWLDHLRRAAQYARRSSGADGD